jgi:ectoine hydroxylase-related dioxygenase (phytanoyl-CoA dioxygenase family)
MGRMDRVEEIQEQGYTIIEGALSSAKVEELRAELSRLYARQEELLGPPAGNERFLDNLPSKSLLFLEAIEQTAAVLELMAAFLGPNFVLASLNARSTLPYAPAQGLHRDHQGQLFYERLPDDRFRPAYIYMQSMWLLDDFTPENGATRLVPRTHTPEAGFPRPDHPYGTPIPLLAPAGSVCVFAASLWHGGGEHTGDGIRRAFHGFCSRPWAMPQYDHMRSVPLETLARCSPLGRRLLGYDRQASFEESWGKFKRVEVPGAPPAGLWEQ